MVSYLGDVPQLAGQPGINAQLQQVAPSGCRVTTVRDDRVLASFRWVCGARVATVTFSLSDGRRLGLGDLLTGGYQAYLSSTAMAQLEADGATNPAATDLTAWAVTPEALQVSFPTGTVSFPLTTLQPYFRHPGPLAP